MKDATRNSTLALQEPAGRRGIGRFVAVGRAVHAGSGYRFFTDELLIRDLLRGRARLLDHAEAQSWLVHDGGHDVARFCLVHDRLLPDCVQVAHFEAVPGVPGVAELILAAARRRFPGVPRLVVGLNGHLDLGAGFLLNAFDRPQMFGLPYSPPHYPAYFQEFTEIRLESYRFIVRDYLAFAERVGADAGRRIRVRPLDLAAFERDVRIYNALCNDSFQRHPLRATRPVDDDLQDFRALRPFLHGDYLLFAEENGVPVGFLLWFPDFHEMGHAGRPVSLLDTLRLRFANPRTAFRSFLIATIAHLPGHSATDVPLALFSHLAGIVRDSNFEEFEGGFIFSDNARSTGMTRRLASSVGGTAPEPFRRFALYEQALVG